MLETVYFCENFEILVLSFFVEGEELVNTGLTV